VVVAKKGSCPCQFWKEYRCIIDKYREGPSDRLSASKQH
jgi:hypothetical protein